MNGDDGQCSHQAILAFCQRNTNPTLREQKLGGLLFALEREQKFSNSTNQISNLTLAKEWMIQNHRTEVAIRFFNYLDFLLRNAASASEKNVAILLKGAGLVTRFYPDQGSRAFSDIDIFIDYDFYQRHFKAELIKQGFLVIKEDKWEANEHKESWSAPKEFENLTLEIHFFLFPKNHSYDAQILLQQQINNSCLIYSEEGFPGTKNRARWTNLKVLPPELELLYLIFHYAYQHTLLKIMWLMDIYLFLKKTPGLDLGLFNKLVKQQKLASSVTAVAIALNQVFKERFVLLEQLASAKKLGSRIKNSLLRQILTEDFLTNPKQRQWRYLTMKILVKDTLAEGLLYIAQWSLSKIRKNSLSSH